MKNKLCFSANLIIGDGINSKKLDRIKRNLIYRPWLANVYVITYAHNPVDQLEFFDARQLCQPYYREKNMEILGIARDYGDALGLIEKITCACIAERGDCNLKEYLIC